MEEERHILHIWKDSVEKGIKPRTKLPVDRLMVHHGDAVCVSGRRDSPRVSAIRGHVLKHEWFNVRDLF